jgi:general secretion pathway protein A
LTPAQTAAYIDHRLGAAGGSTKIFDAESKALIHEFSGGVCRQINNIATACLVHAHAENMKFVNENVVTEIMSEFHF